MVKRIVKFPLKMKNGANVRNLEELRANADVESVMQYYFNGKLSRWCKAMNYSELSEKILKTDISIVNEVLDIFGVKVSQDEIFSYTQKYFRNNSVNVSETLLSEEEIIDDNEIKNKIMAYLNAEISLDEYKIELVSNEKESVLEYCVKVSNITTGQYYRFVISYDEKNAYLKQHFESDLYRRIAKSISFLKETDDYIQKYLSPNVGDTIKIGEYKGKEIEWIVLRRNDSNIYVISKELLCESVFRNDRKSENANIWGKSGVREWLNEEFYNNVFTENEKKKIDIVESDKVLLLSKEEAESLMTEQERAIDLCWWTRSAYPCSSCGVWHINSNGTLLYSDVSAQCGVRPTLYLKI